MWLPLQQKKGIMSVEGALTLPSRMTYKGSQGEMGCGWGKGSKGRGH